MFITTTLKKTTGFTAAALLAACCLAPTSALAEVTFDWATVGNAGNAANTTDLGAVSYEYRIAKTEVTNAQYAEFLNSVAATDTNNLYHTSMAFNSGGITRSGSSGSYTYAVNAGRANTPVTYVSWYDAARFSNWMTNGQTSGGTETGVYTLTGLKTITAITRDLNNPNQVFIPTEDEWYKSAYHDANAGTAGTYFNYANGSNSVPISDQPGTGTGESLDAVNYYNDDSTANGFNDGYAVSGSTSYPSTTNPFTDVGAYTDADSPYGTFDQSGNVQEWNETLVGSYRISGGGAFSQGTYFQSSSFRNSGSPDSESSTRGFRVATPVPEPTTLALIALGAPLILRRRRG